MGYTAYTLDTDFTIPADKIAVALHAINVYLVGSEEDVNDGAIGANTLDEAFAENTGFEDTGLNEAGDWELNYHRGDKYFDDMVDGLLGALAPFAREGSYARFVGEDDSLWGFIVVNGCLEAETATRVWKVVPRRDGTTPAQPQRVILAVTHYADKVRDMNIAVTVFDSEDAALAALREDFAAELAETADDEYADQDRELLDILRWDHNVIAEITPFNLLKP